MLVFLFPRLTPNTPPDGQGKARATLALRPVGAWLSAISPRWKSQGRLKKRDVTAQVISPAWAVLGRCPKCI